MAAAQALKGTILFMEEMIVRPIGSITIDEDGMFVKLDKQYAPALAGLEGFSHLQVLWWFDGCDNEQSRSKLSEQSPYKGSPETLGTFATRSPERPNPLALTCAQITYIDKENGVIGLAYIDANPGSPVLDLKPYTPSLDRVEHPAVPDWCKSWPKCCEASGEFDWSKVFNF